MYAQIISKLLFLGHKKIIDHLGEGGRRSHLPTPKQKGTIFNPLIIAILLLQKGKIPTALHV